MFYLDPHMAEYNEDGGAVTYGGYSDKVFLSSFGASVILILMLMLRLCLFQIVVDQLYVVTVPASLDFAGAAPLLCAGITTYSPIRRFGLKPTHKFAVLGLGGLPISMCTKFACIYKRNFYPLLRPTH